MSELYGSNYQKAYVDNPSQKIDKGEHSGNKKMMFDSAALSAGVAQNDTILLGKIPKGARIAKVQMYGDNLGAGGVFNLGWQAGDNEAADADGFISGINLAGQNALAQMDKDSAGLFKKFDSEVIVEAIKTDATATDAAGSIKVEIEYIVD